MLFYNVNLSYNFVMKIDELIKELNLQTVLNDNPLRKMLMYNTAFVSHAVMLL